MPNELGARAAVVVREEIACLASRRSLVTVIGRQSVAPTGPARPVTDLSSRRDWHPISGTRFGVYPRCNRPSVAQAAGFSQLHVGINTVEARRNRMRTSRLHYYGAEIDRRNTRLEGSLAKYCASSQFIGIRNLPERNKFRSLFQRHPKCDTILSDSEDMSMEYFCHPFLCLRNT
jgi:hypothetical protein